MCVKILGRAGAHDFFYYFFLEKKNKILFILKGISPFKMHNTIFFPEKQKKSRRHQQIKVGSGYPKHRYILFSDNSA